MFHSVIRKQEKTVGKKVKNYTAYFTEKEDQTIL
jgi:hypothetical protein